MSFGGRVESRRFREVFRLGRADECLKNKNCKPKLDEKPDAAYMGVLVVDTSESSGMQKQLVKHTLVHPIGLGGDGGLLSKDDVPSCCRVGSK